MNKFLVIRFEYCKLVYHSLLLCKEKSDGTEYRITVMNGEVEKQLCNNNTIREIKGCLQIELSGNKLQNQIKTEVAKALGKMIGLPVKEVEGPEAVPAESLKAIELTPAQTGKTISEVTNG